MKNKVLLIIAAVYCIIGVIVFAITNNVGASALIWLMAVNNFTVYAALKKKNKAEGKIFSSDE